MQTTQVLRRALQVDADAEATVMGSRRRNYRQLYDRVSRLAGALRALGIDKGDRVAILALNSDRYMEYFFAVWWAGAVVVPLNTRWATPEHHYALEDSGTKALFYDQAFSASLPELASALPENAPLVCVDDGPMADGVLGHDDLIAAHQAIADAGCKDDDLAGIFYTGGTTGRSKGVMLSHRNLLFNGLNSEASIGYGRAPRYLHAAPMFHMADLLNILAVTVKAGQHSFIASFDPAETLNVMTTEKVTLTLLVPTMINMVVNHKDADTATDLTCRVIYGASPMPEAVLRASIAKFPKWEFIQAYGMTELSPLATTLAWHEHVLEGPRAVQLKSCGRAVLGCELSILGADNQPLPSGEIGQIAVRGDNVMQGYWNRPETTKEVLHDGWMLTGDAAYMDENGYVYIVDRVKDMIISGGENIYSAEVEQAVYSHPAVLECAVIGVPDDKWGERVHAIIRLRDGSTADEAEILAHCRTQIGGYKCPRSASFTDQPLPLSGAGKILKTELRKPFWEGTSRNVG